MLVFVWLMPRAPRKRSWRSIGRRDIVLWSNDNVDALAIVECNSLLHSASFDEEGALSDLLTIKAAA
jgi:hypothetical protein